VGFVFATLTQSENCFASAKPFGASRFSLRRRRTQFGKSPSQFQIVEELRTHIGNRADGFVFTTKNGTPWNADLVLKRHLRGKLKVTNGHLHMFRHTFATRQLQAGVPVTVVSKILGHGSISTTLDIYAHVLAEHMEQFERQRARILGTYRAPDVGAAAEEQQVA